MRFGTQGRYTVDFFHVCDYLAEAVTGCAPEDPRTWLETQKKRLKINQSPLVLAALSEALEPASVPDAHTPVRACHRYPSNRLAHLDDQGALAQGLPIGSGEIESAHRYVALLRRMGRSRPTFGAIRLVPVAPYGPVRLGGSQPRNRTGCL